MTTDRATLAPAVRGVLFDLDGTLLDSAPDLGAAANRMRTARGLPALPLAEYRSSAGAGARGMLAVALGAMPHSDNYVALCEEFFAAYQSGLTDDTHPFDGIAPLIDALLQRGTPWGVVTNKAMRFTDPLVRSLPLFASAAAVVSGDTTPHAKPHPEPLFEAARRLAIGAAECVYIGDDQRDITAGRAAGMRTVAAAYGYLTSPTDADGWGADAVVHSTADLLRHLKWLGAA